MKKRTHLYTFVTLMLAALLTLSLVACGGGSKAMSKEEYQQAVADLAEEFSKIQTEAGSLDPTDIDGAKKLLGDLKAPLQDFIDIVPPKDFSDAHKKFQSGSQAMIDFLDTTIGALGEENAEKLQEASEKITQQIQTAVSDFTEGNQLLQGAAG